MANKSFYINKDVEPANNNKPRVLTSPSLDALNKHIYPQGSILYCNEDQFYYVYDGNQWDRISGVNNPVDNLLPITANRLPKWTEDYPPGGDYDTPVLQDSALSVDDEGNAILNDTGAVIDAFPWCNGNFMTKGSLITSQCVGLSLDSADSFIFTPILSQIRGSGDPAPLPEGVRSLERYENGSIAIGYASMENTIKTAADPMSINNVAVGPRTLRYADVSATNNVAIGTSCMEGAIGNKIAGSNNTCIGKGVVVASTTSNVVGVGNNVVVTRDDNVVIGAKSGDGGHSAIVTLGSNVCARGDNRLVVGSGISINAVVADMDEKYVGSLNIQIGDKTYRIPLFG